MSSSEALHPNRTIRWLCEDLKVGLARVRFEKLLKDGEADNGAKNEQQLYKEVFEVDADGNYPIHYIMLFLAIYEGAIHDDSSSLALSILEFSKEFPSERRKMLSATATNSFFDGTILHLAVRSMVDVGLLDVLVRAYPDALLTRENEEGPCQQTPLELSKEYLSKGDSRIAFLEQMTAS